MKKKLFSVLVILFTFSSQKVFAEEVIKNIVTDIPIEKYSYIDIGFSGLALQTKYSRDLTPYYEISGKLGFGGMATQYVNAFNYGSTIGIDFSIENKFFFYKLSRYYDKKDKIVTNGSYIKAFVGVTKDLAESFFPVFGTGIGWKEITNGFGASIGLDIGTTIQKPDGQGSILYETRI